ncbi:MAG: flagellar FlbD family protein [Calditrichaeota bacterium]|nr:flagellar FlbD family protein [Calditrichota bacterium]
MITVTRINNQPITINAEIIEFVESTPDTIITTMTGKKILVKESVEEVVEKIIEYRQRCFEKIRIEIERQQP